MSKLHSFLASAKSKALAVGSVVTAFVASTASTFADSFTGTFTNVMDTNQKNATDSVFNASYSAIINSIYTGLTYVLGFITQPAVLGTITAIGLMYMIYRKVRSKFMGIH